MLKKNTIRILLINPRNELLLMRVVDPSTTNLDKKSRGAFWCTIGGKIEAGETVHTAALRELFEETGLKESDVTVGPIVWHGLHEMIISGQHMELNEQFIVMHTNGDKAIVDDNYTDGEKAVVTGMQWLSLDTILKSVEPIFPAILKQHLTPILTADYPATSMWVDLSLQP